MSQVWEEIHPDLSLDLTEQPPIREVQTILSQSEPICQADPQRPTLPTWIPTEPSLVPSAPCQGNLGRCQNLPALAMGRVAAAGAVLVALVALGAPPAAGAELSAVFQEMVKSECHFINGTDRVKFVKRFIYNREQYVHFDSDVGLYMGDTPYGEKVARYWNSDPEWMAYRRDAVDRHCRHNYELSTPFLVERRVPPSVSISLVPSSSQPSPGLLLCSVMDFYPAEIQVKWFQGQQELSEHVVATDVVPNGDWTYQLLVLLDTPLHHGVSYTCQVEHISLEQRLSRHWDPPDILLDATRSKMLTGIGGFLLGFVFLALGFGFYLCKKVRVGSRGSCSPSPGACMLLRDTPARCHPFFSAYRGPEPLAAAAPPHGLRSSWDPQSIPALFWAGFVCPPQPCCHSAPAQLLPVSQ
ncbi:class II histocompatibility antigen, B-L beta chain-like [Hirundo rustica]|nr:class II histocompatibility antigen, B-L beta chain-like [Hirundo rustica]